MSRRRSNERAGPFLLVVLAFLASACRCGSAEAGSPVLHSHRPKLYGSPYFSAHRVRELPQIDLGAPEALDAVIAARSFKGEIIVTCFTESAIRWQLHYARMAQALGFGHYVAVADSNATCSAFHERWCSSSGGGGGGGGGVGGGEASQAGDASEPGGCMASYPGCGFLGPALGEEWDHAGVALVERLWLFRYHLAAQLARRRINVLMSDLDVVIHGDFYAVVKSKPLSRFHFFQMPGDYYPNGGLWYVQNAHPRGPVVRWIEAAVQRSLTILRMRKRFPEYAEGTVRFACSWVDQDVLKYVMASFAYNRTWEQWSCLHERFPDTAREWEAVFGSGPGAPPNPKGWVGFRDGDDLNPPWEPLVPQRDELWRIGPEELHSVAFIHPPHARSACLGEAECGRLAAFARHWGKQWLPMSLDVAIPPGFGPDGRPLPPEEAAGLPPPPERESVVHSPVYLFSDARVMWSGWATPRPQPWGLVTHLVAFGKTWGRQTGGRGNRMHLVQALGLWHAPREAPAALVRVAPPLARAAAAQGTDAAFRRLVHAVMVAAAVTGRAPVLPAAPCGAAPWMERSDATLHGFDDPHFIAYIRDAKSPAEGDNVVCAPYLSMSGKDTCTDEVVLSEFHLDQDLLYPSFSRETVELDGHGGGGEGQQEVGDGAGAGAAAAAATAAVEALRAGADRAGGARVLVLRGSLDGVLALAGAGSTGGQLLGGDEAGRLAELARKCPDFMVDESLVGQEVVAG